MQELAYAQPERNILRAQIVGLEDGHAQLQVALDVVQYHILQGLAVTPGAAFGHTLGLDGEQCMQLFRALPAKSDKKAVPLHVGGRAFTKHSHRDSSGFWGTSTGTTSQKNDLAEACFERIWANTTWRNLFWLPHGILAYEVRVAAGYGMRFQKSSSSEDAQWTFRGFVEPASEHGHGNGWRH